MDLSAVALTTAVCAFTGWVTNALAIKMIFRPHQRVRLVGPIGWQGVLPRKAERYAREVAEMIVGEFFILRDLVLQIDPGPLRATLAEPLTRAVDSSVDRMLGLLPPEVLATGLASESTVRGLKRALSHEVDPLLAELRSLIAVRIDSVIDFRAEIVASLAAGGGQRLERLVLGVVGRELRWIERSGGVLGAIFGLCYQALPDSGWSASWGLPVVGALVGVVTNWLAIWMIFFPRDPVRVGPFRLQGVLPARRREVAIAMGGVVREEMPSFGEIVDMALARGLDGDVREFLVGKLENFLRTRLEILLKVLAIQEVRVDLGWLAAQLVDDPPTELRDLLTELRGAAEAQVDIAGLVHASLEDMDNFRFGEILRNLLREDEPALVACGGLLGALIGLAQLGLVASR